MFLLADFPMDTLPEEAVLNMRDDIKRARPRTLTLF